MYLKSVSYTTYNPTKRVKDINRTRKYAFAYFFDEDGHFTRQRISKIRYIWYKYFKKPKKYLTFYCSECGYKYKAIVKSKKDRTDCPRCEKD